MTAVPKADASLLPTQKELQPFLKLLHSKKLQAKPVAVYAEAFPEDFDEYSLDAALPELSVDVLYEKDPNAKTDRYKIGSWLEAKANKSALGDKHWIYVRAYDVKDIEAKPEIAKRINPEAIKIYPLKMATTGPEEITFEKEYPRTSNRPQNGPSAPEKPIKRKRGRPRRNT